MNEQDREARLDELMWQKAELVQKIEDMPRDNLMTHEDRLERAELRSQVREIDVEIERLEPEWERGW